MLSLALTFAWQNIKSLKKTACLEFSENTTNSSFLNKFTVGTNSSVRLTVVDFLLKAIFTSTTHTLTWQKLGSKSRSFQSFININMPSISVVIKTKVISLM
jgi:hypothetical protein